MRAFRSITLIAAFALAAPLPVLSASASASAGINPAPAASTIAAVARVADRAPTLADRAKVAARLQAAHVRMLGDPAYLDAFARKDSGRVSEMLRRAAGVDWPVPIAIGDGGGTGPAGWSIGFACKSVSGFPWINCWGGVST